MEKNKSLLFYILPPFLFFIDLILLGLFQQKIISLLFCFYGIIVIRSPRTKWLLTSLLFLSIFSFILHGMFGLSLVYLLPLSIIAVEAKNLLNKTFWLPYAFVASGILLTDFLLWPLLLQTTANPLFTGAKLCVNLVVILIIEKIFIPKAI